MRSFTNSLVSSRFTRKKEHLRSVRKDIKRAPELVDVEKIPEPAGNTTMDVSKRKA
jgi:hypothetical protein